MTLAEREAHAARIRRPLEIELESVYAQLEAVTAERDRLRERLAELGEVDLREAK